MESYFDGEHFEGFGNEWNAIFGNVGKFIVDYLKKSVADGDVVMVNKNSNNFGIASPSNSKMAIMSYIDSKGGNNEYTSASPLMSGIDNQLILKEQYTWKNGIEGEMAAIFPFDAPLDNLTLNFYNPFYSINTDNFEIDKVQLVSLSALALDIEKMKEQKNVIENGAFYDNQLKEFLKENPEATENDFKAPTLSIDAENFRCFIPTEYTCSYEVAGQIEDIEYINSLKTKFAILKVNFGHSEIDQNFYCNVYVSEHLLKNYEPKVGEGIQSIIWLTGYFN